MPKVGTAWSTRTILSGPEKVPVGAHGKTAQKWLVKCSKCEQQRLMTKVEINLEAKCRCTAWGATERSYTCGSCGEKGHFSSTCKAKRRKILELLQAKPARLKAELENEDAVMEHRKIYCRRMSTCLLYAAERDWQSFSCKGCPVDEHMTLEEIRQDHEGLDEAYRRAEAMRRVDELKEKKGVCR